MNKKIIFEHIIQGIKTTFKRFPVVMTLSVMATITELALIDNEPSEIAAVSKLFFTLFLTLLLSIAATSFLEKSNKKVAVWSVLGIFAVLYYIFLSKDLHNTLEQRYQMQYMLWILASITLITIIPFIQKKVKNLLQFWHHNQRILYSFLATIFYSAAIMAGLSIALLSVNVLFDLNIDDTRWTELGVLIVGLFSTTFFLSRFPEIEEEVVDYPKELRIFSFYVLMPLVVIYFLILYSYSGKIIISQEWPKGIISSMILGFSMLGIFTYALIYPLTVKDGLLQNISKWFFIVLLPQIVLLFLAVRLRISEYAITEQRYFVVIFGAWLLGMSLYFLISKVKDISIIAKSLLLLIFIVSFGPWGAFQVSRDSQVKRLEKILTYNNMLVDNKITSTTQAVSFKDRQEISEIIYYLNQNHGLEGIQPWFDQDLNASTTKEDSYSRAKRATEFLGISYIDTYQNEQNYYFGTEQGKYNQNLKVTGFDYIINDTNTVIVDGNRYRFEFATTTLDYTVYANDVILSRVSLKNFIVALTESYQQSGKTQFTQEELSFPYEDNSLKMIIYFTSINSTNQNIFTEQTILVKFK